MSHFASIISDNGNVKFDMTSGSLNDNYFRFDGTAGGSGLDIKTAVFKLDTPYLDIHSPTARMDITDTSGGLRTRIGEVDTTSANNYGLVIYVILRGPNCFPCGHEGRTGMLGWLWGPPVLLRTTNDHIRRVGFLRPPENARERMLDYGIS